MNAGGGFIDTNGYSATTSVGWQGAGALTKQGAGTLTLTGANTYTGGTSVNAGTLRVNGSVASATAVAGGATLGGSGSLGGAVSVADNATLAPGNSAGTLTINADLLLNDASVLAFELGDPTGVAGTDSDLIVVDGDLTLDGVVNITDLSSFTAGTYRLFDYTGILTNNTLSVGTLPTGYSAVIDTGTANQVGLVVTLDTYPVSTSADPAGSGTVTCSPNPVPHGSGSTCTASAETGYTFTGFSGDCSGATCDLSNVTAPRNVTANFSLDHYTITADASPVEGGSVTCTPDPVPHGGDTTCTLTPAAGFRAATAVGGTCPAGIWQDATTYRVEAITAACSVGFAFVLDGACGTAADTPALTAPAGGLCAFGSAGPVTSADGVHAWSCAGDFGGSDAQCSAPGAAPGAYPGNTVTLAVDAGDGCTLDSAQLIDPPGELPAGVELPYGAVDFKLSGCTSATVTLTHAGPVETQAFWKYVDGRWVDRMPVTLSGNQVQFTLTDGSYWDSDPRPAFIADPGGVGSALAAVPALGPWALGLLAGLLAAFGLRRQFPPRRRG